MKFEPHPILTTERLVLRPFREEDWVAAHAFGAVPEVSQYMAWGPNTEAESQRFVQRAMEAMEQAEPVDYFLAIVLRSDHSLIGGCNLSITRREECEAMIGYTLHPEFWGQGYTTEAAAALLRFGFGNLGLHRITSWCDPDNTGSWRVMEKIGMRREGHEREAAFFKGRWHDWLRYAILDHEWRAGQS